MSAICLPGTPVGREPSLCTCPPPSSVVGASGPGVCPSDSSERRFVPGRVPREKPSERCLLGGFMPECVPHRGYSLGFCASSGF